MEKRCIIISIKIILKLKIDSLCTIYISWIIINHSFIQINFTCVLFLIKNEENKYCNKKIHIKVSQN